MPQAGVAAINTKVKEDKVLLKQSVEPSLLRLLASVPQGKIHAAPTLLTTLSYFLTTTPNPTKLLKTNLRMNNEESDEKKKHYMMEQMNV